MSRFDPNPSWVSPGSSSDAERYGKQVAVRFDTEELKRLDELVTAKAKVQHYPRVTRSSVVTGLVTAAHNKLLNDRRRYAGEPLPSGDPDVAEVPEWQRELERKVHATKRVIKRARKSAERKAKRRQTNRGRPSDKRQARRKKK